MFGFLKEGEMTEMREGGGVKREECRHPPNVCRPTQKRLDFIFYSGRMGWMAHRKWKEIELQPSMLPGPAVPGSCLASFHFRWAIPSAL